MTRIQKRDGRWQAFQADKIYSSLYLASRHQEHPLSPQALQALLDSWLPQAQQLTSTQALAQSLCSFLDEQGLSDLSQSYQNYHMDFEASFCRAKDLSQLLADFQGQKSQLIHENANKDARVFNTQRDLMAGLVAKSQGLSLLPPPVARAHHKGTLHFHDLDYSPYAQLNYDKHLSETEKWLSGEAVLTYAKEKTLKDIYDAMQSLEYEINTLFSSNGQTPFVSLGFGLGRNWLEREIQKAILNIRLKGLGREGRTAIFPKLIFTLKRELNLEPGSPNYDIKQLALSCATKRMYPDVLSYDKVVDLTGSFKVPMGCRSFLQGWTDADGREVSAGRMNLGVVTLNLPRLALRAWGSQERFWQLLEDGLDLAHEALVYRINRVKEAQPSNAPILYQHGAFGQRLAADEAVDQLFNQRRATISLGYIGLYEVATAFYGGDWEGNPQAKAFTVAIIKRLKKACDSWSEAYGYHFSVYSTPSESLTDRFCRLDKASFGTVEDITDKGYYTNSFHYDVRKRPTPFEKLDFESVYPEAGASGGFIHYCEYPVIQQNPKALEAVWDYAYDRVGYLGTNTPIDKCFVCQFEGDFDPTERGFKCPNCGNSDPETVDVVKRTCGYLGNPQARPMVAGRHKEIMSRVKHMNSSSL